MENITTDEAHFWKVHKAESGWHYNPADTTPCFDTLCSFKGNWDEGISRALSLSKENSVTVGEYKPSETSESEEYDILRQSGKHTLSLLHVVELLYSNGTTTTKDDHPAFDIFFKMINALGMYDPHYVTITTQRLGQISPFHIDRNTKYFTDPVMSKKYIDAGCDKNPLRLRRIFVSLVPWNYGHMLQFGNQLWMGYNAGECITFDWLHMPHGTANAGWSPRINLQATGFVDERFDWLLQNGSKDHVIDLTS